MHGANEQFFENEPRGFDIRRWKDGIPGYGREKTIRSLALSMSAESYNQTLWKEDGEGEGEE